MEAAHSSGRILIFYRNTGFHVPEDSKVSRTAGIHVSEDSDVGRTTGIGPRRQ
jgi:hypothetical protein